MSSSRLNRWLGYFGLAGGALEQQLRRQYQRWTLPPNPISDVIAAFGRARPEAVFIQIGANDGVALDPLREEIERRAWSGLMIEPVPYIFARLQDRYQGHPRIQLVNAAIADRDGRMPFYSLREAAPGEKIWPWYHALGSFRKDVVLKHVNYVHDIAERIVEIEVPCLSFQSLCDQHGIKAVDIVQIDTEGYDYEIVKHLCYESRRPLLIVYEHRHLSDADRQACRQFLSERGYQSFEFGLDTAALDYTRAPQQEGRIAEKFELARERARHLSG